MNFVKLIQLEDVYGNIVHICCTACKWIFDKNLSEDFSLTKTSPKIICGNDNDDQIDNNIPESLRK